MFNYDHFINKPCQNIFGRPVIYTTENKEISAFKIIGDFHEAYIDLDLKNSGADISTAQIVLFVRLVDFPVTYPTPQQGDITLVNGKEYQVIDVQPHIPGSNKLILHENE